ncbi:hypothetical protein [uncultured Methanomethylovorans sp.]
MKRKCQSISIQMVLLSLMLILLMGL